jgi:cell wall-associated NlpC family hydrolase
MTDETRQNILEIARSYIGKINHRDPQNPLEIHTIESGMSCYHFVRKVLSDVHIFLPREYGCWEMWNNMEETFDPLPGDLIFLNGKKEDKPGHVGFYAGSTMIHCSRFHGGVVETSIPSNIRGYRSIEKYIRDLYGQIPAHA